MASITVIGLASGRVIKTIEVNQTSSENLKRSLMDFLILNNITIASSCAGAGTCKKCIVNAAQLSCQISVQEFLLGRKSAVVEVSYL